MRYLAPAALLIVAVIHLLPVSGVLGAERLASLYGVSVVDPNLSILLRHRAVLFALLGGVSIAGAFLPALRTTAFVVGGVSVLSFLLLAFLSGGYNAQVARVVTADMIAAVCLAIGLMGHVLTRRAK
jgi:hypothetical protein